MSSNFGLHHSLSWYSIYFGFFKLQPSELAKPILIVTLACLFEKYYKHLKCRNSNSIGIEMCCYRKADGTLDVSEKVEERRKYRTTLKVVEPDEVSKNLPKEQREGQSLDD